jgi:hypothetical protein
MNLTKGPTLTSRSSTKHVSTKNEIVRRRRHECFAVLTAIAELLPREADSNGRAAGILSVSELSVRAAVSRKAVGRALAHWRCWRVLWLAWKGDRRWDVRFERRAVDTVLGTAATAPQKVGQVLVEHRRQREAAAPRRVPKTSPLSVPQVDEKTRAPMTN